MDLVVYDDDDRRYVPWLVSLAAVLAAAVLAAGVTFLLARQTSADELSGTGSVAATAPSAAPSARRSASPEPSSPEAAPPVGPSADCTEALDQADLALETSTRLEQALAAQTRVMDELLASRVTTPQALDQSLPVLTRAATDRRRFAEELSAFRVARQGCSS